MSLRSPTLEGFRAIFRRPSLGLAEIAWRWSFGAAAGLLLALTGFEYLGTLLVTRGDLLLLRSRQPVLISEAVGNILRGSGFRLMKGFSVLAVTLALGWMAIAALARAATVKALLSHFRGQAEPGAHWRLSPLLGLNFLRAATALAAVVGVVAAFVVADMASPQTNAAPGQAFLIIMLVGALVWMAWSMINWLLSLAAIFVVAEGQDTFSAIAHTVDFLRRRRGPVFAVGTAFGLAHFTAFIVASIAAAFPLGLATILPGRIVLAGVLIVALLYFAVADFLYIGRLAAYVAILELPEAPVLSSQPSASSFQPNDSVDPTELILSDVPAQS